MQEQQNFTRLQQISVCSFDTNLERQTALLNPALNKLPVLHCIAIFHIHHSTAAARLNLITVHYEHVYSPQKADTE